MTMPTAARWCTGTIVNTAGRDIRVPKLRIALLDEAHQEIQSGFYDPPQANLPTDGTAPFDMALKTRRSRPATSRSPSRSAVVKSARKTTGLGARRRRLIGSGVLQEEHGFDGTMLEVARSGTERGRRKRTRGAPPCCLRIDRRIKLAGSLD